MSKKKPRKIADIEAEEISLVDRAANKKKFAIIKAAAGDEDAASIEGILQEFLGEDYPAQNLKSFKQAVAVVSEFAPDTLREEDVLDAVKVLVWTVLEAMAGGFKLKEADEEADEGDAVDEGKNGKGKSRTKKAAVRFPTLSATPFMKNFMFGSRVEKWLLEEALQKSADDDEGEPEPAVRRGPVRKSLTVDDVPDDDESDEADRTARPFIIPGLGVTPTLKKKPVKKSADVQDDDDKILWPSLGGGQY